MNYESEVQLSIEAREEQVWWNGKALVIGDQYLTIETDASPLGWGAVCNGVRTGAFGHNPRDYSTSTAFVVKAHKTQVRVLLLMDNVTAVTYINKMRGYQVPHSVKSYIRTVDLVSSTPN